jgi:NTE family protein
MGADRLIVVDVGTPIAKRDELTNPLAILNQVIGTLSQDRVNSQLAKLGKQDLLIRPELGDFSSAAFDEAETAIPIGISAAEQSLDRLQAFRASPAVYAEFTARHQMIAYKAPTIEFVHVDSGNPGATRLVERELQPLVGRPLDSTQVDGLIESVYGSGYYQTIRYQVVNRDDKVGLEVTAVDKPWGPNIAEFGFTLSNDFKGDSDYQVKADVTFQNVNDAGGELRNRLRLGGETGIQSEFYQPFGLGARFFATGMLGYTAEDFPLFEGTEQVAEYRVYRGEARAGIGTYVSNNFAFGAGMIYGHDWIRRHIGAPDSVSEGDSLYGAYTTRIEYDTLDNAIFPAHGMRLDFDSYWYRQSLGSDANADSYKIVWDGVVSSGENHFLFGTRLAASTNSAVIEVNDALGGFLNLSGYPETRPALPKSGLRPNGLLPAAQRSGEIVQRADLFWRQCRSRPSVGPATGRRRKLQ